MAPVTHYRLRQAARLLKRRGITLLHIFLIAVAIAIGLLIAIPDFQHRLGIIAFLVSVVVVGLKFQGDHRLSILLNSMATRYVGPFPDHLLFLTNLIDDAKETISVFSDGVDYGSFASIEYHARLLDSLLAFRDRKKTVRLTSRALRKGYPAETTMLIWGPYQKLSIANRQKARVTSSDVEAWIRGLENTRGPISGFANSHADALAILKQYANNPDTNWIDGEPSRTALDKALRDFRAWEINLLQETNTADKKVVDIRNFDEDSTSVSRATPPSFLFWIIDEEKALLILPRFGTNALAFFTQDGQLVGQLSEMFAERLEVLS